jgi:hypothetical protein
LLVSIRRGGIHDIKPLDYSGLCRHQFRPQEMFIKEARDQEHDRDVYIHATMIGHAMRRPLGQSVRQTGCAAKELSLLSPLKNGLA